LKLDKNKNNNKLLDILKRKAPASKKIMFLLAEGIYKNKL